MYCRMRVHCFMAAACLALLSGPALARQEWKPVDPAELALKSSSVEKDADAEAIFWEVRVKDEDTVNTLRTVLDHYIRIKVFTERGKEWHGKIEIPYPKGFRVANIAGRTIKPDGTVFELKKDAIFDRTIVKTDGLKVNAKSFVMPAVEPGALIEYRWREERPMAFYFRLYFQQ